MTFDHGAPILRGVDRSGMGRVEVADHEVSVEPERERGVEAGVRRNDKRWRRKKIGDAVGDRIAARDDHHGPVGCGIGHGLSLRWHDPVQVPRVGDSAVALSARRARAPRSRLSG